MKNKIAFALITIFTLAILLAAVYFVKNISNNDDDMTSGSMYVSWAESYGSVEELAENSDLIALVEVTGISGTESRFSENESDDAALYMTVYSADVIHAIKGEEKDIRIIMTGKKDDKGKTEVVDDSLMDIGDKYLIFARCYETGTYTILGGPQGRFTYNADKNTISTFHTLRESASKSGAKPKIDYNDADFTKIEKQIKNHLSNSE